MNRQTQKRLIKLGRRLAAVEDLKREAHEVAEELGTSVKFVSDWRDRYRAGSGRVNALLDRERPGRPLSGPLAGVNSI